MGYLNFRLLLVKGIIDQRTIKIPFPSSCSRNHVKHGHVEHTDVWDTEDIVHRRVWWSLKLGPRTRQRLETQHLKACLRQWRLLSCLTIPLPYANMNAETPSAHSTAAMDGHLRRTYCVSRQNADSKLLHLSSKARTFRLHRFLARTSDFDVIWLPSIHSLIFPTKYAVLIQVIGRKLHFFEQLSTWQRVGQPSPRIFPHCLLASGPA